MSARGDAHVFLDSLYSLPLSEPVRRMLAVEFVGFCDEWVHLSPADVDQLWQRTRSVTPRASAGGET